jgi:anti-sigma-K factor RskA
MTPEDRSVLAGELALGVLEGPERAEALRLVVSDRGFAREVEVWRAHFDALYAETPEQQPDPALEERVLAALASSGPRASEPVRLLRRWRAIAAAAMAVAAALLVALLVRPEQVSVAPAPAPIARAAPLVAVLAPTEDGKPFAALVDRDTGEVRLAGLPDVPAGRSAELWTIAADGVPRSAGVVPDRASRLTVAAAYRARLAPGVTLAISIEPAGGSRKAGPEGPVIATGALGPA